MIGTRAVLSLAVLILGAGCAGNRGDLSVTSPEGMPRLVPIPAGEFDMGAPESEPHFTTDEGPVTHVVLKQGFQMSATEITVGQFRRFIEESGYETTSEREGWSHDYAPDGSFPEVPARSWRNPGIPQTEEHPVVCVTWDDAMAYCRWMSSKLGKPVTLPTEAQWEYACRAGSRTAYWWGDDVAGAAGKANLYDDSAAREAADGKSAEVPFDDGHVYTAPVASYQPNAWGLFDMHGNVWEYCLDWHSEALPGGIATDPRGAATGDHYVRRGGSFMAGAGTARSANRGKARPDFRVNNRGFRIVNPGEEEGATR